ncbi:hypothetical protein ACCO45_003618 [Purpureocillium lilacinum]|uniref:Uncharacterized protein n=1 Tax=Purpureocillium lilacinum TaxID=33203 RepID=A0ACC4E0D5_PURLI
MASQRLELALGRLALRPLQQPAFPCAHCRQPSQSQRRLNPSPHHRRLQQQQQRRSLATSAPRAARAEKPAAGASLDPKSAVAGAPIEAPRSYGKRVEGHFVPKPLPRPIGMPLPPSPARTRASTPAPLSSARRTLSTTTSTCSGEKSCKPCQPPVDPLLLREGSRDRPDLASLLPRLGQPPVPPGQVLHRAPRLFKAELSLFFPNLYGETLLKTDTAPRDTTPLLAGRASVVSIFSSQWAEQQVASFTSRTANPALHDLVAREPGLAQLVNVNYEDNAGKAWLVRLFRGSLRKRFPEQDWDKYFLVRRGITDSIRESIGLLNTKVGYTYLVDHHCRIRWAGSGTGHPDEVEGLTKGLARLVDEIKRDAARPAAAREQLPGKARQDSPEA